MGTITPFPGRFNGGSRFCILVANPFVETPPWAKLCSFLEASMGVAILHASSKSFRGDPPHELCPFLEASMGGRNFAF